MYLSNARIWHSERDGSQRASGNFLMIFNDLKSSEPNALFALVRKVEMSQAGHFMVGKARVGGKDIALSGSYGSDGLPMDLSECPRPDLLVRVPDALAAEFWAGGGHNSAGSEAPAMRQWAQENLGLLTRSSPAVGRPLSDARFLKHFKGQFMQPEIENVHWYEVDTNRGIEFIRAEDVSGLNMKPGQVMDGESNSEVSILEDFVEGDTIYSVTLREGWGARMSASGYMDQTDWSVFDTKRQAQDYLIDSYGNEPELASHSELEYTPSFG